jgi:exodeoxyribonuclease VII small subunit
MLRSLHLKKGLIAVGDDMTFEEAFQRAEALAKQLESGSLTLEESIEGFKEAMRLIEICQRKIGMIEKEIQVILDSRNGVASFEELPFMDGNKYAGREE